MFKYFKISLHKLSIEQNKSKKQVQKGGCVTDIFLFFFIIIIIIFCVLCLRFLEWD